MRVGIVGAGISGLAAAYELKKLGIESVVFEKSNAFGGRCATRRIGEYVFDTGATTIAPRGRSLENVMLHELDGSELVRVGSPIYTHTGLRVAAGDPAKNKIERFSYRSGNTRLAKLLGTNLDIRFQSVVEHIERDGMGRYRVLQEEFDALVLTPPAPQTLQLLAGIGEFRPLANVSFRSCLSVLLGYAQPAPTTSFCALVEVEQRHPLTWLSLESVKSPGRAPEGCTAMVAQMSPQFSALHLDDETESIIRATTVYVERLFGKDWREPALGDVKRWRYSQPEMTAMFESVNQPASRLVIAGDSLMGGRVEFAYESGVRAAVHLEKLR